MILNKPNGNIEWPLCNALSERTYSSILHLFSIPALLIIDYSWNIACVSIIACVLNNVQELSLI